MPSVERLLAPGERVVYRTRLHPVVLFGGVSTAAFIVLVATLLIRHNQLPPATEAQIALVGAALVVVTLLRPVLRWRRTAFLVTDHRVLIQAGAFRPATLDVPIDRPDVLSADGGKSYGTLTVAASDGRGWRFAHVAAADKLAAAARPVARRGRS
jgi:hypothetical protein